MKTKILVLNHLFNIFIHFDFSRMCTENYGTSHQAHYKPYEVPNGTESMPPSIINQTSGFFRERAVHIPNSFVSPVKDIFISLIML